MFCPFHPARQSTFQSNIAMIVVVMLAVTINFNGPAHATVFAMPSGQASLELVTVGNPGNAPDSNGLGAVDYMYMMGKFEVTAAQYTVFLNAVAKNDTYGLYDTRMATDPFKCNIERTGSIGNFVYSVASDWANRPVTFIDLWDAARFCNWLNNGQLTGAQDLTTTEDGAYFLNGSVAALATQSVTRQLNARYVIPSLDEWYKAAFHKNDGMTGNYWDYATGSDSLPSKDLVTPDAGNNANYSKQIGGYTIGSPYYRTEVGEFENSESPYGTFDQAGNVWEWNEAMPSLAGLRGGSFYAHEQFLLSSAVYGDSPPGGFSDLGFRIAQVNLAPPGLAIPEPATATLGLIGLAGLMMRRRRMS